MRIVSLVCFSFSVVWLKRVYTALLVSLFCAVPSPVRFFSFSCLSFLALMSASSSLHADEGAQLDVPNLEIGGFSKATIARPVPIGTENLHRTTVPSSCDETLAGLDRRASGRPRGGLILYERDGARQRPPAAVGRSLVGAPQDLPLWHDGAGRGRGDAVERLAWFAPTRPVPRWVLQGRAPPPSRGGGRQRVARQYSLGGLAGGVGDDSGVDAKNLATVAGAASHRRTGSRDQGHGPVTVAHPAPTSSCKQGVAVPPHRKRPCVVAAYRLPARAGVRGGWARSLTPCRPPANHPPTAA